MRMKLFHQKIHWKLRWNRKELFAVLNDCHWKLTVSGVYSAFLMSTGRLNVSSGVFGPLFLIKQRRLMPVYTYILLSSILVSRNSFICSLDRKKCPLVPLVLSRHFYLSCLVSPFLILCVSRHKFVRCLARYVSFFPSRSFPSRVIGNPKPPRERWGQHVFVLSRNIKEEFCLATFVSI